MKNILFWFGVLTYLIIGGATAHADVKLPALFSDNMVLQRGQTIPIYGTADAGEAVSVSLGNQKGTTTADAGGKWEIRLPALPATDSVELSVSGKNTLVFKNVAIGEVWLASGQSNMQMSVNDLNEKQAIIAAAANPHLRLFSVPVVVADEPQKGVVGHWNVCSPESVAKFSAVGYLFGRELQEKLGVTVGIIHSSRGATSAQAWTSRSVLEIDPDLKKEVLDWDETLAHYPLVKKRYDEVTIPSWQAKADAARAAGQPEPKKPGPPRDASYPNRPTVLFNGMIAPLMPFGIKGVIWYQGENNAGDGRQYRTLLPMLIHDWRRQWGEGDFPFLLVQLANYTKAQETPVQESGWAEVREAQMMALAVPNTAMASAIDIGEAENIHPKNKQEVAHRLALAALATQYGQKMEYSGPLYASMAIEGAKIRLKWTHAAGLKAKAGELTGFAIAGADKKWVWAEAKIEGETVIVSNPTVTSPVAVRYSWASNPTGNLYNGDGLPASPFRTDSE